MKARLSELDALRGEVVGEEPSVVLREATSRKNKLSKLELPSRNNNRNVTASLHPGSEFGSRRHTHVPSA